MTAPIRDIPKPDELLMVVRNHQDLIELFRIMKARYGLTNEFCDDIGGLTKGQTDKTLGPSQEKSLGRLTFDVFTTLFALEFHAKVDMNAVRLMEGRYEMRQRPAEHSHTERVSKKLLKKAKPLVLKETGRLGGMVRCHLLTPKLRKQIARMGGKSRMEKATKEERTLMAKKGWETRKANRAARELAANALIEQHPGLPAPECPSPNGASIDVIRPPA